MTGSYCHFGTKRSRAMWARAECGLASLQYDGQAEGLGDCSSFDRAAGQVHRRYIAAKSAR